MGVWEIRMIINLWSTPRTGSVWYSKYLSSQYQNSKIITELFNRYHMNIYHIDVDSGRLNFHEYQDNVNMYYEDYVLLDGVISKTRIYSSRVRNIDDEEIHRLALFEKTDPSITYILHNHVMPMNINIRQQLLNTGENLYIYRQDRRAQLGSYAIAIATKQFVKLNQEPEDLTMITSTNMQSLKDMIERIRVWDNMPKQSAIAYENIDFTKSEISWPQKQNSNYTIKLSSDILSFIDMLVSDYETNISKNT
jgi:hypothetical protein